VEVVGGCIDKLFFLLSCFNKSSNILKIVRLLPTMPQSLEALETLLLYHGGGNPPTNQDPSKRHSIRAIIEVMIGQFIGFFVAVWCIFRSVDSMFAPRFRPHDDSFVFVPSVGSQNTSQRASVSSVSSDNLVSNSSSKGVPDKSLKQSTNKSSASSSSTRKSTSTKTNKPVWAPRSYSCKIVDIRSKQTGTAIARLGASSKKGSRDSNGELRRRLIEFTIETRSRPLDDFLESQRTGTDSGVFSTVGEDPALVMASGFHQMGLGNATGIHKNDSDVQSILAGKVIRRQTDCEAFRAQVLIYLFNLPHTNHYIILIYTYVHVCFLSSRSFLSLTPPYTLGAWRSYSA
jgi:hypothetical protein